MKTKILSTMLQVIAAVRAQIARRETLYVLILVLYFGFFAWHISAVPELAADVEYQTYQSTSTFSEIADNPLSLPYKVVGLAAHQLSDSVRAMRLVSMAMFGVSVIALYRVLKRWHSEKIALLTTAMYTTNAMVLAVARLASPQVLLLGWALLISLMLWVQHGKSRKIAPAAVVATVGLTLYIPGAPYFLALIVALFYKKIVSTIRALQAKAALAAVAMLLLLVGPLIWAFIQDTSLIRQWLLLPPSIDWLESARNILRVPSAFIYRSPVDPLLSVGRLPVLDVAAGGLFLVGLYVYQQKFRLERTRVMLLTALLACIIGALGQVTAAIVILLPFVYTIVAAGISYLLDEWYIVFPRNPFARSFGLLVVTFVVLMSTYYQMTRFLVVWPQTPETRAEYNQPRLVQ